MTKRIFSVLLALALVLALSTSAMAATITVDTKHDEFANQDYSAYKIFDLTVAEDNEEFISYKVADGWEAFFAPGAAGLNFVDVDAAGNVTPKANLSAAAFAKAAMAYAELNKETLPKTTATAANKNATLTVDPGYYLVDSSAGALCVLKNNTGTANIEEKNNPSTIDKNIIENATLKKENDVSINDVIDYKIQVNAKAGTDTLKVIDWMEAGLTFNHDIVVTEGSDILVKDTDYVIEKETDNTFDIKFLQKIGLPLESDRTFIVTYTATLNENAEIAPATNDNQVKLQYGSNYNIETNTVKTETKTFVFDVFKYTGTGTPLEGAKFTLSKTQTGDALNFKVDTATNTYKLDPQGEITILTSDKNGKIKVVGLDTGKYYLKETEPPAGYNKIADPIEVTIDGNSTVIDGVAQNVVNVLNNHGTKLPETGGIGTTIFYVVGGLLMAAAVVLLVAKKRTVNE